MTSWRQLPGPARGIGLAISQAVDAAGEADRERYQDAAADLAAIEPEQAGQILGAIVLALLEEQHPDGLDSDDIQAVLGRCYRGAAGWLPPDRLDVATLVAVLASALGIQEPGVTYEEITGPPPARGGGDDWAGDPVGGRVHGGGQPPAGSAQAVVTRAPTPAEYAWHAPLVVADLLAAGRRPLARYLDAAFMEIARAETMEMP
jgi:hypothetical protein